MHEERLPLSMLKAYPEIEDPEVETRLQKAVKDCPWKWTVLDDDPTGVQTVHDVYVYTEWTEQSFREALQEEQKLFYILTNSRSFSAEETIKQHRLLAEKGLQTAMAEGKGIRFISRGDSTLRGHYLLEPEVLRETIKRETGKDTDGCILCPCFLEGGRYTLKGVHYIKDGQWLVPAGQTEFAKDETFGFHSSHLGEYVEEKSGGTWKKEDCLYISIEMLREKNYEEITRILLQAHDFVPIVVDGATELDLKVFSICLYEAMHQGKTYMIRSAASLPKILGGISTKPLLSEDEIRENKNNHGGLVIVGSHVKKTTIQLENLRKSRACCTFLEFHTSRMLEAGGLERESQDLIKKAEELILQGETVVIYTSRTLMAPKGMTREEKLALSVRLSDSLTSIVSRLGVVPGFILAKGGITSSDVGTKGLHVKKALVMGQVLPGIPVWKLGEESRFPGMAYIIFPGNVGGEDALKEIVDKLTERTNI